MSVRRELVKLLIFLLITLGVSWLLWSTLLNAIGGNTRTYVAEFSDISGLHEGDNVRIAGVRVGRVNGMRLVGTHAEIIMSVLADQPVFSNTRALIRYQNLVGQRYLALVPGPGPARPLPDGGRIPLDHTEPSFDLSALFDGFAPLFSVLQPAQVNQLANNIVQVLQGSGPEIDPLLAQTARLTNTIADRDRIIGSVLANLNQVLDQVAGKGPQTDALLAQARRLVDGLNQRTEPIFGSLERIRRFTGNAQELLADIRPDVRRDVRSALDASAVFVAQKGQLRETLATFPGFLAGLARVAQYGSWANLYACAVQIHAAPGVPPGGFGSFPGDAHSEVCR
jgi:phospholipid/cholesterol/gamma-HCH transport system substrate-binding protein